MARFYRISCGCPGEKNRRGRKNYLGAIQVDVPNITHHHCGVCNRTWEHKVNGDGIVSRKEILGHFDYLDEIAIVS